MPFCFSLPLSSSSSCSYSSLILILFVFFFLFIISLLLLLLSLLLLLLLLLLVLLRLLLLLLIWVLEILLQKKSQKKNPQKLQERRQRKGNIHHKDEFEKKRKRKKMNHICGITLQQQGSNVQIPVFEIVCHETSKKVEMRDAKQGSKKTHRPARNLAFRPFFWDRVPQTTVFIVFSTPYENWRPKKPNFAKSRKTLHRKNN